MLASINTSFTASPEPLPVEPSGVHVIKNTQIINPIRAWYWFTTQGKPPKAFFKRYICTVCYYIITYYRLLTNMFSTGTYRRGQTMAITSRNPFCLSKFLLKLIKP